MKVLSLAPMWRDELAARLRAEVTFVALDPADHASVLAQARDAQVVVTAKFDAELAAATKALELIVCPAAGTEGIDRAAVPPGVEIVNGIGHEAPMAEYVIGALVALRQRFAEADRALREGRWRFGFFGDGETVGELQGSALGIVGFGRIGVEIARRAQALGMTCRAVTLHPDKKIERGLLGGRPGAIDRAEHVDDLVESSDAIAVACELSPLTRGLIDERRIGLMRRSAVIVNVARGPIVDERALFEALSRKSIAGAAIDVWYRYPSLRDETARPSEYPYESLDNVLMTPHSSGWTDGMKRRKLEFLAACINEWPVRRDGAAGRTQATRLEAQGSTDC